MRTPSNAILPFLARHGPGLTSTLAAKLQEGGLSAAAARQRLSRLPEEVKTLYGLPFPKRARFIYLENQFGTQAYWDALIAAIEQSNPAHAAALAGLQSRGGIVPRAHFDIVSGAPKRQKRHVSSETILQRLESVRLVRRVDIEPYGECVSLALNADLIPVETNVLRARLTTESVLLDTIKAWAVRMNMASPKATKVRDKNDVPQFATFCFDLCGPCYLRPIRRRKDKTMKPGFLVGDIITGTVLSERHVGPFLRKCRTLGGLRNLQPFLPMLIADGFTPEALRACRAEGVIATTPAAVFGQDVARALKDLFETLTSAATVAATDPDRIEKLFSQLSKVEGAAGNLRGALFELIVGHMVRNVEGGSIDLGSIIYDRLSSDRAEVDVMRFLEKQVTAYECRGYQPTTKIGLTEAEEWLHKRVPIISKGLRQREGYSDKKLRFELWTCGSFSDEALDLLKDARGKTTKYEIAWRDGSAVRAYAAQMDAPGIRKILDEHYFKHPLKAVV
jgi:hypothetical protein